VLVAAAAGCFVTLALPFFFAAPHHFFSEVFGEQLFRQAAPIQGAGIGYRLVVLTGFGPTTIAPSYAAAEVAFAILVVLVAMSFGVRAPRGTLDGFFITARSLSAVRSCTRGVLSLLRLLPRAVPHGRRGSLCGATRRATARGVECHADDERLSKNLRWAGEVGGALIIFALVLYLTSFYSSYTWGLGLNSPEFNAITHRIPAGACVVYSEVSYGIEANRWTSSDPHCPTQVDPLGMWMAWDTRRSRPPRRSRRRGRRTLSGLGTSCSAPPVTRSSDGTPTC